MSIDRRAILFALACGFTLLPVSPASAELRLPFVSEITEGITRGVAPLRKGIETLAAQHADAWASVEAVLRSPYALAALLGFVLFAFGLRSALIWRRGRGSVSLRLLFPEEVDGDFDIRLYRRSPRKPGSTAERAPSMVGTNRRHTRRGVRRETQFEGIQAGAWRLRIEGTFRAKASHARLARVDREIEIEIVANDCSLIEQSMPTIEVPVEFRVRWDRQPARDVGYCLSGKPSTLRYANQGLAKTRLPLGTHSVLIGSGDRVIEQTVSVDRYEPHLVPVDLATPEGLIFKGCPPAVSPFLQGDVGHAARVLDRDGQATVASLLLARLHHDQGQLERAAEEFENASQLERAAELRESIAHFAKAASLFESANQPRRAAEMFEAALDWAGAARLYGTIDAWTEAARCFRAAGDTKGVISALEGQGEFLQAAELADEFGDRARSIRLLQMISPQHPEFGRAGRLLSLAYENEGHLDLAANQLARSLAELPPGDSAPELEIHLSELLDGSEQIQEALAVLEALRDRDPTYPGIASRIEALRKRCARSTRGFESASLTSPPDATAFVSQERYALLEEIGRGGMSLVYKARDRRLDRIVAVKRMPDTLLNHPAAVQLFLSEAQAAARMNHPNIVTLYDADQENGRFFITMELLEGLPLSEVLKENGRFGPRDTARLGLQVCAGLQFAHDHGIVHRDIKTSNLFITQDHVLKIMDFGLAKILEAVRDDRATVIAGTPFYMAPEQKAGQVSDGRTDLYSLGVTLFELSTGRLPFAEGDVAEQHRRSPVPDPRRLVANYPSELAELILRLMAKRAEDRPARADEVADSLRRFLQKTRRSTPSVASQSAPPA